MGRRRAARTGRLTASSPATAGPGAGSLEEAQAVVVTHWFDPGSTGEPYRARLRLVGRRSGVSGPPQRTDSFERDDEVGPIVPGSGPIAISSRVESLTAGEWSISASLIRPRADARGRRLPDAARPEVIPLRTAQWSWRRWSVQPAAATAVVRTRWWPLARLARTPAIQPGTVPAFVAVGALVALAVLSAHVGGHGLAFPDALAVTAIASLAGLAGAKLWYARLHPGERLMTTGWAVDGFVVVAPIAAALTLMALGLAPGAYLDDVTPSLFLAVALGRLGCFFTGCCAGRPTSSRWGVWSSDQRVGARRVPTQLLESGVGLMLGGSTLLLVLVFDVVGSGVVFIGGFATYLAVRQLLIRLRAEPRRFLWERSRTIAAALR